jgi:hypothetical protein
MFGNASCVPVGECTGVFPPAGARLLVDASLATEDATHFKSITAAVNVARAGDVVAVFPGNYVEEVIVPTSNISIIGRCARDVTIASTGGRGAGFLIDDVRGVAIRGVTLRDHFTGVLVRGGGEASLEDSRVLEGRYLGVYAAGKDSLLSVRRSRIDGVVPDAAKFGWGAAAQLGGALDLEDVAIHAATSYGIVIANPGSKATVKRAVVRETQLGPSGSFATGLAVSEGSSADVDGLLVENARGLGVTVSNGTLGATHVVVVGTTESGATGRGIQVTKGGRLDLEESFVLQSDDANVLVIDEATNAKIRSSVFSGDPSGNGTRGMHGVRVAGGASLDIASSALIANVQVGLGIQDPKTRAVADSLYVKDTRSRREETGERLGVGVGVTYGGALEIKHSAVEQNRAAGVFVSQVNGTPATASVSTTLIRRTLPGGNSAAGRGVEVSRGGIATLDDCAIADNMQISAIVGGAGSALTLRRSIVRSTAQLFPQAFGHGVLVANEASLVLESSWLLAHPGVGLAVDGATVSVAASLVSECAVGLHVQGGSVLATGETVPTPPAPATVFVTNDTRFIDNETRVGSGDIPLPDALVSDTRTAP